MYDEQDGLSTPETGQEAADKLEKAHDITVGSEPEIADPSVLTVELPRGLYSAGKWETTATVRELTGEDEEIFAKQKTDTDQLSAIVALGTSSIGAISLEDKPVAERRALMDTLLVGERELLFIEVSRATFGDERELTWECSTCGNNNNTVVYLSTDFPLTENDVNLIVNPVLTTKGGNAVEFRYVTGADQATVLALKGGTTADQNTKMLTEVLVTVNGKPAIDPVAFVRRMTMKDRQEALKLVAQQPRPNTNVEVSCPSCDGQVVVPVSWGNIFRF